MDEQYRQEQQLPPGWHLPALTDSVEKVFGENSRSERSAVNISIGGAGIGIFAGGPPHCLPGKSSRQGQPPS
jgi:hypothetical protein